MMEIFAFWKGLCYTIQAKNIHSRAEKAALEK